MCASLLEELEEKRAGYGGFEESLGVLDLNDLELEDRFPDYLGRAVQLPGRQGRVLVLLARYNLLVQVERAVAWPEDLREVDLSDNRLQEVPHGLCVLKNLTVLRFANNEEDRIVPSLSENEWASLRELDISGNNIREIPNEFCSRFPQLQVLSANRNELVSLPTSLGELPLRELYLSGNRLGPRLPSVICKLSRSLESLGLASNQLVQLPEDLEVLGHLKSLALMKNDLEEFPEQLLKLQSLSVLDLSNNRLSSVPPEIECLSNLKKLFLGGNRLRQLPPSMGDLASLRELDISNNGGHFPVPPSFSCLQLDHAVFDRPGEADAANEPNERVLSMEEFHRGRRKLDLSSCWTT